MATISELSNALDKVLALRADSYHIFLREASLIAPPVFLKRDWNEVQNLMKKRRCKVAQSWENGDFIHKHYLLKKDAFTFSNLPSLNLYLMLSAPNLNRPMCPGRPGMISVAGVALVAEVNAPYARVVGEKRFPKGTVLDAILSFDPVKEAGEEWPLLGRIYMYYEWYRNRRQEFNPSGFSVRVEFTASLNKTIGEMTMFFFVVSGLDHRRSADGRISPHSADGTQEDTLDGIIKGGSTESWSGDQATVEANKRKYLKTPDGV